MQIKAIEVYDAIEKLLREIYPAIIDVARCIRDKPDYEKAIGKAQHLVMLTSNAMGVVEALKNYDPFKAHKLLIELLGQLYDDLVSHINSCLSEEYLKSFLEDILKIGLILNIIIAKAYIRENYAEELGLLKKLVQDTLGIDLRIPDNPTIEQLHDILELVLVEAEKKYYKIVKESTQEISK